MKTKNKVVLLALCMVALIAVSVLGTMAYLTSTDQVVNTFTVGNVNITLDELDTDSDENTDDNVIVNGVTRDKANSYHLLPGHSYVKDPTIHVATGSEPCYLFVKVTNDIAGLEAEGDTTIASQMAARNWTCIDAANGIYAYGSVANAGDNIEVFSGFKLANNADVSTVTESKKIEVTAYAIQADGFEGKTPAEIWTAASFN